MIKISNAQYGNGKHDMAPSRVVPAFNHGEHKLSSPDGFQTGEAIRVNVPVNSLMPWS